MVEVIVLEPGQALPDEKARFLSDPRKTVAG